MIVKKYSTEIMDQNCYLVFDPLNSIGFIIDSPKDPTQLIKDSSEMNIKYILITHCHFDHIWGIRKLKEKLKSEVAIGLMDNPGLTDPKINLSSNFGDNIIEPSADIKLSDGDSLSVGQIKISAIHCPGHSPGSFSYLAKDKSNTSLFTGDTLFKDGIGRTDLTGGSYKNIVNSLDNLNRVIKSFKGVKVYPGHGDIFTA